MAEQKKKTSVGVQAKPLPEGAKRVPMGKRRKEAKPVAYNRGKYKRSGKPYCPDGKHRFPKKTGNCLNKSGVRLFGEPKERAPPREKKPKKKAVKQK